MLIERSLPEQADARLKPEQERDEANGGRKRNETQANSASQHDATRTSQQDYSDGPHDRIHEIGGKLQPL